MEYNHKVIGENIAKYRKANGLSQRALALKINFSQSYINNLENGTAKSTNINTIVAIAKALGVSLDVFIFEHLNVLNKNNDENKILQDINTILNTLDTKELMMFHSFVNGVTKLKI